jgi:hypothetical protein
MSLDEVDLQCLFLDRVEVARSARRNGGGEQDADVKSAISEAMRGGNPL